MVRCFFVAGTDTDVGKTHVSSLILKALKAERLLTCGFKPVASGSERAKPDGFAKPAPTPPQLFNSDALMLQQHASIALPYQLVNPFCFEPAIAPHVAALDAGADLSVDKLDRALNKLIQAASTKGQVDVVLTEGAGGWHVPLNNDERFSDWVAAQQMERQMGVVLVVGLKLGAINHALLSVEAIEAAGVPLLGWVANRPTAEPMAREEETLNYLKNAIQAPLLANVAFSHNLEQASLTALERATLLTAIGYN